MKLDIEGCEALAIKGARTLLTSGRVSILHMEFSPSNIRSTSGVAGADMLRELHDMGFDAFLSDCHHSIDHSVVLELSRVIGPCDQPVVLAHSLVTGVPSSEINQHIPPTLYDLYTKILEDNSRPIHCCMTNMFFRYLFYNFLKYLVSNYC
jgi:hypothetical protein